MYFMMNATGWGTGLLLFWVLHVLSIIIFGVGTAFLLFFACRRLTEQQLWTWGWSLLVSGIVACMFVITSSPFAAVPSRLYPRMMMPVNCL